MYKGLVILISLVCFSASAKDSIKPEYPWFPLSILNGYTVYGDANSLGVNNNNITMLLQYFPAEGNKSGDVLFAKLSVPVKTCTNKQGVGKLYDLSGNFIRDLKYVVGGISAGDGTVTSTCFLFEEKLEENKSTKK